MARDSRKRPLVTIGLLSRNRPAFLKESVSAIFRSPGADFELLLYSNASDRETLEIEKSLCKKYGFTGIFSKTNDGFRAIPKLIRRARGKYYVWFEDDFIWLQPGWLGELVRAIENGPGDKRWGIISMINMVDSVTNGAMWKSHFEGSTLYEQNGIEYLCTKTACGAPFIMHTDILRSLKILEYKKIPTFGTFDALLNGAMISKGYPVAHIRCYAYHANQPFWAMMYQDNHASKQGTNGLVRDMAMVTKMAKADNWNFSPEGKQYLWKILRDGNFRSYADSLYERI